MLPPRTSALALLVAIAAACSSPVVAVEPEDAATCEALVDLAAERIETVVKDLGAATVADLEEANPEDPFATLTEPFVGFAERAEVLGCIDQEVSALTCDRLDGITAGGPAASEFLERYYAACS